MTLRTLPLLLLGSLMPCAFAQTLVRFPLTTGVGTVSADLYGTATRAVILAHGGRFHKESWASQARVLADHGFLVLAIAFRGDGLNPDGSPDSSGEYEDNTADVLAAIHYLQGRHITEISAVGASLGGDAVGNADAAAPGALSRIVILAAGGGSHPERLNGRKLFILARDDRSGSGLRLPEIQESYRKAPEPKQLVLLDGSAHAQFLFATDQGSRLLSEIERFLTAK